MTAAVYMLAHLYMQKCPLMCAGVCVCVPHLEVCQGVYFYYDMCCLSA